MELDEYQEAAETTAIYGDRGGPWGISYVSMQLAAEAGEVVQIIAKLVRDTDFRLSGTIEPDVEKKIAKEMGDVHWCLAELANQINYYLSEVAQINLEKLQSRKERGTLQGSGDDR